MRIAIIGAGSVGGALARGWARAGHEILLGVRDPAAERHAGLLAAAGARAAAPAEAAAEAEVVLLALPWVGAEGAVRALGDLAGKVVIDAMNPLVMQGGALGLDPALSASGGEAVAAWLPGARVVKTLNQVGAETMADATGFAHPPAMFLAGDDAAARAVVADLLGDLGFEPLDAGDLSKARLLEPLAMLWINQALFRGKGRNWAFAAPPRGKRPEPDRAPTPTPTLQEQP